MENSAFQIVVPDYSASTEEWRRAKEAPTSELPKLSEAQKDVARKFEITEEEYARGVLAGLYGHERMRARAKRLGDRVRAILNESGKRDRVIEVVYDLDHLRWILGIESSGTISHVSVPRELADDVLDWGLRERVIELKERLVQGMGLERTLVKT